MRRGPIEWPVGDDAVAQGLPLNGDTLISYGGWLERIAFATEQRLTECQEDQVDYMVHISADAMVNDFQIQSLRKVMEGDSAFNSSTPIDAPMKQIYYDLLNFMTGVKHMHGSKGTIAMEFDWNHPSTAVSVSARPTMDQAIQASRSGLMLAAYQYASAQLDLLPDLPQGRAVKTLAFGDLSGVDLRAAPDEATLHQLVDQILFN